MPKLKQIEEGVSPQVGGAVNFSRRTTRNYPGIDPTIGEGSRVARILEYGKKSQEG
jgi:hypothetical protein